MRVRMRRVCSLPTVPSSSLRSAPSAAVCIRIIRLSSSQIVPSFSQKRTRSRKSLDSGYRIVVISCLHRGLRRLMPRSLFIGLIFSRLLHDFEIGRHLRRFIN